MKQRVTGIDFARALAVFGMVIVNFKVVMGADSGSPELMAFAKLFEGRASALFVILAGMGVTFLSNRARLADDRSVVLKTRISLVKRGLLLVALGLLYTPIWEADILHFYGFYFLIAAIIFTRSDRALLLISLAIMLIFPILMLLFDYGKHWDWSTLTYEHFWSLDGMIRHVLFNGFHPVFPWAAFLVFGMWLGRQDLALTSLRNKLLCGALLTLVSIEYGFDVIRSWLSDASTAGMTPDEIVFLFSTSIIPPLPQYVISAASSAVIILVGCLYFTDRFTSHIVTQWLNKTGQMSLTLYVAHVVVGMGILEAMGLLNNQDINTSLLCSLIFCISSVLFSVAWLRYFKIGPLEWLFRRVAL